MHSDIKVLGYSLLIQLVFYGLLIPFLYFYFPKNIEIVKDEKITYESISIMPTKAEYLLDTIPTVDAVKRAIHEYKLQHKDIVLAQAILETGHFKSYICRTKNNLFGLYNSKTSEYYSFDHWSDSIIAYKEWIQSKYNPPEDYYYFLKNLGYAEDVYYNNKLKEIIKQIK